MLPADMKKSYHNPHYSNHLISVPFRMLVVAQSGGGKTNFLLELIHRMSDTFERIIICCKSKDEPLYELLEKSIPRPALTFFEGIKDIPKLDSFDRANASAQRGRPEPLGRMRGDEQILVAFDDLVTEKDQKVIEDYFIRGRKVAGGVSCVYLSQSYFKVPKLIRLQCGYLVLKKLSSSKDLNMILKDFSLCEKSELMAMYKKATSVPNSFLMIDVAASTYRNGFLEDMRSKSDSSSESSGGATGRDVRVELAKLTALSLENMKVKDLRVLAKELKSCGVECQSFSKLRKDELISRLLEIKKAHTPPDSGNADAQKLTALIDRLGLVMSLSQKISPDYMSDEFKRRFFTKTAQLYNTMVDTQADLMSGRIRVPPTQMSKFEETVSRYETVFDKPRK